MCGLQEGATPCVHEGSFSWGQGRNQHWKICNACGIEIGGTRANHIFVNGSCVCGYTITEGEDQDNTQGEDQNNTNNIDNTIADKPIPQTGIPKITIPLIIVSGLAIFGLIKIKKYKVI